MKIRVFYLLFLQLILLLSCNAQEKQTQWPSEALIMPTGVSPDSLPDPTSHGARLEVKYCKQCHPLPSPANHNSSDWVPVFRRMLLMMESSKSMGSMMGRNMMGMMRPREAPDPEEQKELLLYLQKHALLSINKEEKPEPDSQGAVLFDKDCSRCHALPSPSQHSALQWPSVVSRMRQHMVQSNLGNLKDEEANAIIAYLEKHASGESHN